MAIPLYLAMTALEFRSCPSLPDHSAWMACHFSSYATGLSNFPPNLPQNSIVILNDRTPIYGHDPEMIARQLNELRESLRPSAFLLDFQRPGNQETAEVVQTLVKALPCPVGVSVYYAMDLPCPVFVSAPKPNMPLKDHLAPWKGREIWLEAALDSLCLHVTQHGCKEERNDTVCGDFPFVCDELHCHYRMEISDDGVQFYLKRTWGDMQTLLDYGKKCGITTAVGLYQEFKSCF